MTCPYRHVSNYFTRKNPININFLFIKELFIIMSQEDIIPNQIPAELMIEKRYNDIILYVLSAFGPLERSEFINSPDNNITKRMNKNTFYKWIKELKSSNYIKVEKDERKSVYSITELGLDELLRRLKRYQLDFDTINKIEQQRIKRYINSIKQFFAKYEIYNEDLKAEFIELANEITHDKLIFFSEIKFNKLLLFICLNHPKFYLIYTISEKEFISKFNIITDSKNEELTTTDIDMFLQRIFEEKIYGDKIYRLKLENNGDSLYFRVNGEYGSLLQTILKSKFRHLYNLNSLEIIELNNDWLEDVYENILNILIEKLNYFNEELRESLKTLLNEFKSKLIEEIKRNPSVDREILPYYSFTNIIDAKEEYLSPRINVKEKKEFEKNLNIVNEKLTKNPLDHEKLLLKAELLYKLKKEAEALVVINKVLKLKPKNVSKYLKTKAIILQSKKMRDIIVFGLELLEKKKGKYFIALIMNAQRKCLKIINRAILLEEDSQYLPLYFQIQADLLIHGSNKEEALNSINKALELNNNFIESKKDALFGYENFYIIKAIILYNLKEKEQSKKLIEKAKKEGDIQILDEFKYYSQIGDFKKAISLLNILIKENPEDLGNYDNKAWYLAMEGKFEESNKNLDFLLEKVEDKIPILKRKLSNFFGMRDYDNAVILIDQVYIKTPSERSQKLEDLFKFYKYKKKYKESLYVLNKLIKTNLSKNNLLRFLLSKSRILVKLRKCKEALEFHENLIKDLSDDPEEATDIDFNKAFILANLGEREKAINIMESLLELKSVRDNYKFYKYGKILMVLSEYEEAIKKFQEALKIKPKDIPSHFKIAKCYNKLNNSKFALEKLNKIKKIAQNEIKEHMGSKNFFNRYIEKANKKIEELKVSNSKV